MLMTVNHFELSYFCFVTGGSALLPAPVPPVTLEDKNSIVKALVAKGATIQELNIVRQQLSLLKGGKLLKLAHPAKV